MVKFHAEIKKKIKYGLNLGNGYPQNQNDLVFDPPPPLYVHVNMRTLSVLWVQKIEYPPRTGLSTYLYIVFVWSNICLLADVTQDEQFWSVMQYDRKRIWTFCYDTYQLNSWYSCEIGWSIPTNVRLPPGDSYVWQGACISEVSLQKD